MGCLDGSGPLWTEWERNEIILDEPNSTGQLRVRVKCRNKQQQKFGWDASKRKAVNRYLHQAQEVTIRVDAVPRVTLTHPVAIPFSGQKVPSDGRATRRQSYNWSFKKPACPVPKSIRLRPTKKVSRASRNYSRRVIVQIPPGEGLFGGDELLYARPPDSGVQKKIQKHTTCRIGKWSGFAPEHTKFFPKASVKPLLWCTLPRKHGTHIGCSNLYPMMW